MSRKSLVFRVLGLLALMAVLNQGAKGQVITLSASLLYKTPETISPAPAGFGAFGGEYFIPDFNRGLPNGNIWVIPPTGGAPTSFATVPLGVMRGGLFLPSTGWGANSGRFLTDGPGLLSNGGENGLSQLYTYSSTGTPSLFLQTPGSFSQPQIAPAGFGSFGGQLIVGNVDSANLRPDNVLAISPTGVVSVVANTGIPSFGVAFAPAGFGNLSGDLFVSSASDGRIVMITPNGTVTPFATLPLNANQPGLFQIAFSPSGFFPGQGPLMFVSVRGSLSGGGTLGDVEVLNSSGGLVADLRTDLGLAKFDPRGMFFPDNQHLIISDSSDPILELLPSALQAQAVPEPSPLLLLVLCAVGMVVYGRTRRGKTASIGV